MNKDIFVSSLEEEAFLAFWLSSEGEEGGKGADGHKISWKRGRGRKEEEKEEGLENNNLRKRNVAGKTCCF